MPSYNTLIITTQINHQNKLLIINRIFYIRNCIVGVISVTVTRSARARLKRGREINQLLSIILISVAQKQIFAYKL